jgi:hypothetical protein
MNVPAGSENIYNWILGVDQAESDLRFNNPYGSRTVFFHGNGTSYVQNDLVLCYACGGSGQALFYQAIVPPFTIVAQLPAASANAKAYLTVTDAAAPLSGSAVTGGGTSQVLVASNGTNWIVMGGGTGASGNGGSGSGGTITTGSSGALDCATTPGVCDIVTAIVPLKSSANIFTGVNKFSQLQTSLYTVANLPTCNSSFEGQMEGVIDATSPSYLATVVGGGSTHLPVYCNGTNWVVH